MTIARLLLFVLSVLSLHILTEANFPFLSKYPYRKGSSFHTSAQRKWTQDHREKSNSSLMTKGSLRSSSIEVFVTYYPVSSSCTGGNFQSFSYNVDTMELYKVHSLYDYFFNYFEVLLPGDETQNVNVHFSGCEDNIFLDACYNGGCSSGHVGSCIDLSSLLVAIGASEGNTDYGSILIDLRGPSCTSVIQVYMQYYAGSYSCDGGYLYTSYYSDSTNLYNEFTLYNFISNYFGVTLPSITENVNIYFAGCGDKMLWKTCYDNTCQETSLQHCIDISSQLVRIGASQGATNYGSIMFEVTGPPCSSFSSFSSGGVHCLSEDSKVYSSTFEEMNIRSIKQNDYILTFDPKSNATRLTRVIGWLDKKENAVVGFREIKHEMGYLKISPYHLLLIRLGVNRVETVFAKEIKVGDKLLFKNSSVTATSQVIQVKNVVHVGAFAPLTMDGTFLANGVLVSCYAHFPFHQVAHLGFAPYRWYNALMADFLILKLNIYIGLLKALLQWSNIILLVKLLKLRVVA